MGILCMQFHPEFWGDKFNMIWSWSEYFHYISLQVPEGKLCRYLGYGIDMCICAYGVAFYSG